MYFRVVKSIVRKIQVIQASYLSVYRCCTRTWVLFVVFKRHFIL